jgi:hypothetical protein
MLPRLHILLALSVLALFPAAYAVAEDGGGGGGAGAILEGIAANIQAAAPAVIAGIQAKADVDIAKINSKAQLDMTQISADTSKFLAEKQSEVALYQAQTAKDINLINQTGQTERLEKQLSEVRAARIDARDAERERLRYEQYYNQQRIALAYKQANDNQKLARATLDSQLVQAGLKTGFTNFDSGKRLAVSNPFMTGVGASGTSAAVAGAANAFRSPATRSPLGGVAGALAANRLPGGALRGVAGAGSKRGSSLSRLMASVSPRSNRFASMRSEPGRAMPKALLGAKGMKPVLGPVGAKLAGLLANNKAAGSSRATRFRIPTGPSDLATLTRTGLARFAGRAPASFSGVPHSPGPYSTAITGGFPIGPAAGHSGFAGGHRPRR